MSPTRRIVMSTGAGVAVLAASAIGYEIWRGTRPRHYPPTPYDDLLDVLEDREAARQVGAAFLKANSNFTAVTAAHALRNRLHNRALPDVLSLEVAGGHITETAHWIMPETLTGLCALAAKV